MVQRRYLIPLLMFGYDLTVVSSVPFIALLIRFEGELPARYVVPLLSVLPATVIVRLATFFLFRLYHRLWRHAGLNEMLAVIGAATISSLVISIPLIAMDYGIPRSLHILSWGLIIGLVGFSRIVLRVHYHFRIRLMKAAKKVLIVGAGDAGAMLAKEVANHCAMERTVVGFVDDDTRKQGQRLLGIPVLGGRNQLAAFVEKYDVAEIYIAMPSVSGAVIRQILEQCPTTHCSVRILPGLYDILEGKVVLKNLRNVDLEDLLRREPVRTDLEAIAGYLKQKVILVTGAGGSIGSEICRQVARLSPSKLLLLGRGENSIYDIHLELSKDYPKIELVPLIADVKNEGRIKAIFAAYKPQVVFHAAAHKHVPLMELQPEEAICNNVKGTQTVAEAADAAGTETFIMISTDKAVNPTSVMGASKRVAELIIQRMSQSSKTRFAAVRFGNVLGSRGSVVPLFKKQIERGGPVTVTHPEMRRYFMTIPEATQLVLQAGAMASGGEIFVLDMGEPVRIVDMAEDLIRLSGLEPYEDIDIVFSQIRPGEKMFEELLTAEEGTKATQHEKIFVANLRHVDSVWLEEKLEQLMSMSNQHHAIIQNLQELIPAFRAEKS